MLERALSACDVLRCGLVVRRAHHPWRPCALFRERIGLLSRAYLSLDVDAGQGPRSSGDRASVSSRLRYTEPNRVRGVRLRRSAGGKDDEAHDDGAEDPRDRLPVAWAVRLGGLDS